MATTFDEVLLSELYSAIAEGGPEFSTAIVRSGEGGSIASRAETREDYQSKYQIKYAELDRDRKADLRSFAILRKGMARGFRMLAPDDNELDEELVGVLNTAGELARMQIYSEPPPPPPEVPFPSDITVVYLIKYYSDQANSYIRRIVKPSPFEDIVITLIDGNVNVTTIPAGAAVGPDGSISDIGDGVIGTSGDDIAFLFYFHQGKIVFDAPLPANCSVSVSCTYHLPVAFTDDWQKFRIDESTYGEFDAGLEEILPIELGILDLEEGD